MLQILKGNFVSDSEICGKLFLQAFFHCLGNIIVLTTYLQGDNYWRASWQCWQLCIQWQKLSWNPLAGNCCFGWSICENNTLKNIIYFLKGRNFMWKILKIYLGRKTLIDFCRRKKQKNWAKKSKSKSCLGRPTYENNTCLKTTWLLTPLYWISN